MGIFDIELAYKGDSQLVVSRVKNTVQQALDPSNRSSTLTSIKIDFANGQLLMGQDPRYIYKSPEVKIDSIALKENEFEENDSFSDSATSPRIAAGADVFDVYNPLLNAAQSPSADSEHEDSRVNAPFLKSTVRQLPSVKSNAVFHEFVDARMVAVVEHKMKPMPEHEVRYLSSDDIMKWMEHGENASLSTASEATSTTVSNKTGKSSKSKSTKTSRSSRSASPKSAVGDVSGTSLAKVEKPQESSLLKTGRDAPSTRAAKTAKSPKSASTRTAQDPPSIALDVKTARLPKSSSPRSAREVTSAVLTAKVQKSSPPQTAQDTPLANVSIKTGISPGSGSPPKTTQDIPSARKAKTAKSPKSELARTAQGPPSIALDVKTPRLPKSSSPQTAREAASAVLTARAQKSGSPKTARSSRSAAVIMASVDTETEGFGGPPDTPFDHEGAIGCIEDVEMDEDGFVTKSVQCGGNYQV